MKEEYIFLDVASIKHLIAQRTAADKYRNDELSVAVFLAKFCEKFWGRECGIGFPLKISEARSVSPVGKSNIEEVKNILNNKAEQDHDVDVVIASDIADESKRAGQSFQIKNFNTYQADLTTDGIVKFIRELQYAKTDAALVILLQTGEPTKFSKVHDIIIPQEFSFSALYFVGLYGDKLRLIEVWPGLGKEEVDWATV